MANQETFMQIYKFGTYYNPAGNHYGRRTSVICDRCKRSNLNVCIGWLTYDLCLRCVQEIDTTESKGISSGMGSVATLMQQSQFNPSSYGLATLMEQSQFTPSSSPVYATRMMQRQFGTKMEQSQFTPSSSPVYTTNMMQSQFVVPKPSDLNSDPSLPKKQICFPPMKPYTDDNFSVE